MRNWLAPVLLLASGFTASAQVAEFSFGGGIINLNGEDLGSGYSLGGDWRFGFRVTLNNWTYFGHEFGYAYNRLKLRVRDLGTVSEAGFAGHQGLYHFLAYATPEGSRFRPFATGGGHFTNYVWPGTSVTQGAGETKFGVNYGGGIKVKLFGPWLLRADFKQYLNGKPFTDYLGGSGSLRMNEMSVGLAFGL